VSAASRQGLGHEPSGAIESGSEGGRLVQEWPGIEHLEHFRVWVPDSLAVTLGEPPHDTGQAPAPAAIQGLEKPPVAARGQKQVVVRNLEGQVASERLDGQVLVYDEQASSVVVAARQGRVVVGDSIQGCLELVPEIPIRETSQELATLRRDPGVTCAPASAALLGQLLSKAHPPIIPGLTLVRG
jgi:hypothetical protein